MGKLVADPLKKVENLEVNQTMARRSAALFVIGGWLGLLVASGCSNSESSSASNPNKSGPGPDMTTPEAPEPTGPFAAGKKVFARSCARCHSTGENMGGPPKMGGEPGKGGPPEMAGEPGKGGPPPGGEPGKGGPPRGPMGRMGRGPNLSKVAADPKHTREWIVEHIKDPQKHKPESRMPKFEGKLKDEDIQAVADYLASLK
jgi:mono/diheme cytochrome c family protein